MIVKVINSRK